MKKTLLSLVFAASVCLPVAAFAVDTAESLATSGSLSAAVNQGNNLTNNFNSPGTVEYKGKYSVATTGSAVLPGFSGSFSSDYCGGTAAGAIGGVGFSLSAGAPKIDNSCVMLRTFERTQQAAASVFAVDPELSMHLRRASLELLAETDPKVKDIFQKRGLIPKEEITEPAKVAGYTGNDPIVLARLSAVK